MLPRWFAVVVLGFASLGCTPGADTPSSQVSSGYNGISCDVDYNSLQTANLQGITINDQGIGASEKRRHLNELNAMPRAYLDVMRGTISVNLTAGSITEFSSYAHLRGVTPRGWEGSGKTWDDIPGAGSTGALYLGDSFRPQDAASLAVHEATHSVDFARSLRGSAPLRAAYDAERSTPHPSDRASTYRLSYPEEYLAMAVDEYYCNATTRAGLQRMYPRAFQFVERDLTALLTGGTVTPDTTEEGTQGCSACEGGRRYCGRYTATRWLSGAWESCQ